MRAYASNPDGTNRVAKIPPEAVRRSAIHAAWATSTLQESSLSYFDLKNPVSKWRLTSAFMIGGCSRSGPNATTMVSSSPCKG